MREWIDIITEAMSRAEALQVFADQGVDAGKLDADGLKKARNTLVKKHHPDRGGDPETVKGINAAYDVLKNGGAASSDASYSPRRSSDEGEYPVWAMAGYAGGYRDTPNIYRNDFTDLMYFKKRMWELSGKSTEEWTIMNFDGHFFRGSVTVFGSPKIFHEMASAMRVWDRFNDKRAIFAQKRREDGPLLLIWSDGMFHDPPIPMEHDSFNANPANDQSFVRRLPDVLDRIRKTGKP